MPEGYYVQIDPDGDEVYPSVTYLPQTLSEEQKAQARANIGACTAADALAAQPKMELIDTITIEEENIGNIVRDGFALDAASLVVNCPVSATTGKLQPRYHYPTANGSNWATMANLTVTNTSNKYQTNIEFYKRFGWWRFEWHYQNPNWTTQISTQPAYNYTHYDTVFPYINKITLITTDLPVGTTIKIYGVRRNEN